MIGWVYLSRVLSSNRIYFRSMDEAIKRLIPMRQLESASWSMIDERAAICTLALVPLSGHVRLEGIG